MNTRPGPEQPARPTIVLVHGRDFKPPEAQWRELSMAAIGAGIGCHYPDMLESFEAADRRTGYYGDLTNALLLGAGRHYDESLDIGDRRRALHELQGLRKKKHFGLRRYESLPGKSALPEFAADMGAPVLGAIGLGGRLIGGIAADVQEYWNEAGDFAERVRERVRVPIVEALERDQRIMLVSHGTGSIVSYDVLWQLSHDPAYAERYGHKKIDHWLTLGAPLGDSMVRRRLLGGKESGRTRYPGNVLLWQNVSAEDDYMCHDSTLSDDYRAMLKLRQVSAIRDYRVYNLAVRYGKSNPHSSIGYLIHPRVSKIVCDWLRQNVRIGS